MAGREILLLAVVAGGGYLAYKYLIKDASGNGDDNVPPTPAGCSPGAVSCSGLNEILCGEDKQWHQTGQLCPIVPTYYICDSCQLQGCVMQFKTWAEKNRHLQECHASGATGYQITSTFSDALVDPTKNGASYIAFDFCRTYRLTRIDASVDLRNFWGCTNYLDITARTPTGDVSLGRARCDAGAMIPKTTDLDVTTVAFKGVSTGSLCTGQARIHTITATFTVQQTIPTEKAFPCNNGSTGWRVIWW